MATYTIMTGEGGELGTAQDYEAAVKVAQREADERGETVFVAGPGLHTAGAVKGSDEDIGEAVEPSVEWREVPFEAPTTTPDLLLTRHHLGEVVVGRACLGERGVVVSVFDATTLERVSWDELTVTAEPVTVSGWYRSRVGGWVRVEWDRGAIRARAWASDATAMDRHDDISPAERAARDAQNDLDARISAELAR